MFAKIKSLFTRKNTITPADTTPAFNHIPGLPTLDLPGPRPVGLSNTPAPTTRYGFAPTYVNRFN